MSGVSISRLPPAPSVNWESLVRLAEALGLRAARVSPEEITEIDVAVVRLRDASAQAAGEFAVARSMLAETKQYHSDIRRALEENRHLVLSANRLLEAYERTLSSARRVDTAVARLGAAVDGLHELAERIDPKRMSPPFRELLAALERIEPINLAADFNEIVAQTRAMRLELIDRETARTLAMLAARRKTQIKPDAVRATDALAAMQDFAATHGIGR